MEPSIFFERYHRQLILEGFGMEAQKKLGRTSVLVAGAGGLGCPVLLYLAASGMGKIGIVDEGMVELSNLQRQVLYSVDDIGKYKADCAKRVLNLLNPEVEVISIPTRLDTANCLDVIRDYDLVVDGLDNFQGKYMMGDACALLSKPLIFGAITRFEGQVAIFNVPSTHGKVNYRDIYPDQPYREETMSCSEAGVLGILPGIIGSFQAGECIKLVTGLGEPLVNKLLTYHALTNRTYIIALSPSPEGASRIPANEAAFQAADYALGCRPGTAVAEIDPIRFWDLIRSGDTEVVDVRDLDEAPGFDEPGHLRIPLPQLSGRFSEIKKNRVIFVCQSGKRSFLAALQYSQLPSRGKDIYSLRGGLDGLDR